MNKFLLFCFSTLLFVSCQNSAEDVDDSPEMTEEEVARQSETEFFNRSRKEVMSKLRIPANENFKMQVYREQINSDTITDAIITVNRLQYAMDQAVKKGRQAKMAESGFMGYYNYFIYYDGATDKYSVPIPVGSSPYRPLDVSFEHVLSPIRKDVLIDYRVLNSGYRMYFSVFNETDLLLVFQWKQFDFVGKDQPEALFHKLVDAPNGKGKDILIYKSEIDGYNKNVGDVYQYVPKITKQNELVYHFTFDPRFTKYRLVK